MPEKAAYYAEHMPWVHESLMREPRGHRNMLGSILTDPVSDDAAFGVIFLHPSGMFDGCGDSTFATATALIEAGMVPISEPITAFKLDTVLGQISIEADVENGVVKEVRFGNVPSYHVGDFNLTLSDGRVASIEVAFGGLYYGFIDAGSVGIELSNEAERQVVATAQSLWQEIGSLSPLVDPTNGKQVPIDLFTFVTRQDTEAGSKYLAANVYQPGSMGRTPSGTGSSAHIALRVAKNTHDPASPFIQQSLLGLHFTGTATRGTLDNDHACVMPKIGTKSYMMGLHQFVIDPEDPFSRGFIFGS